MPRPDLTPHERIILALDFSELRIAKVWVEKLRHRIKTFKVGPILFLDEGPIGIKEFRDMGAEVFLDLKFHDIPNTVAKAMQAIHVYEPAIVTVHASGGRAMMEDAKAAAAEGCKVVAVTMLTSLDTNDLTATGV